MSARQHPFSEEMTGGRQLRLFNEDAESGPATTAGPAPGGPTSPSPATDTTKSRTEVQP